MSTVEVRWADLNDWKQLAVIHSEAYRSTYKGIIPDEVLDQFTAEARGNYFRNSLAEGKEHIALLLVDETAVGFMILGPCKDDDLDNTYGEVWAIYFLKDFWGKGLGKKLLNWGYGRLIEMGYSQVALWVLRDNANARGFYERLGFVFDGTERMITRGKPLAQLRGQKRLN